MNKFKFKTIFSKLVAAFLLLTILLTIFLGVVSYSNYREQLINVARNHLMIISRQTNARMYDIVEDQLRSMDVSDLSKDMIFLAVYEGVYDEFRIAEREIIDQLEFEGDIYMLDETGEVMLENFQREGQEDYSEEDFFQIIAEDDELIDAHRSHTSGDVAARVSASGFVSYEEDGEEYIAAYSRMRTMDWILIVDGLKSDILAPAEDVRRRITFLGIIGAVVAIIISILISRYISKPVENATNFANQIAQGNFDIPPLETKANDEIGILVKYLNNMRANLEEKVKNIENLLDNVGQGFLSFGSDLKIDQEYSKKCNDFFEVEIANRNVIDVLFKDEKKVTEDILDDIFTAIKNNDKDIEGYIYILPDEIRLNGNIIEVEYKVLWEKEKMIAILTDVTEKRAFEHKATKDGLTGLYNHSHFQDVLDAEIERAVRYNNNLSLLMLDIDNFKSFNDTYGHQAGDEVLKHLGKLLEKNRRQSDIIARYGGEEFAVILTETDKDGAAIVGERINKVVRNMVVNYKEHKLKITVSIGCSELKLEEDDSKKELINRADNALYKAKELGKDQLYII